MPFEGLCRATGIGSLPHEDVGRAIEAVFEFAPDLPYWPQLPKRGKAEGMIEQVAEGFPGLVAEGDKMIVRKDDAFFAAVERLFDRYEKKDASAGSISAERAAAFEPFVAAVAKRRPVHAKGQICGPITFATAVLDEDGKPILYDPVLADIVAKHLWLKARWQSERLAAAGATPVVFVDEPVLATFGSAFFSWSGTQVREVLDPVYSAAGITGTHCCSNTDWAILLESPVGTVSFDAFEYSENFLIYGPQIAAFLARGGNIAWGVVPTGEGELANLRAETLVERIEGLVDRIASLGTPREKVLRQSLITPACGLGTRSEETARRALRLALDVSTALRRAHFPA